MKVTFSNQSTNQYYSARSFKRAPKNVLQSQPVQDTFTKTAPKAAGFLAAAAAFLGLKKTKEEENAEHLIHFQLNQGYAGDLNMHKLDASDMYKIHEELKDYPKVLKKIHLTKNDDGKIPMHYAAPGVAAEIGRVFADQPGVLKTIYLTKNKKGKTPLFYATPDMIENVYETFDKKPSVLKKIYLVKNKRGKYPIHDMGEKEIALTNLALLDHPDILVKLYSPDSIKRFNKEALQLVLFNVNNLLYGMNLPDRQRNILKKSKELLNERIAKEDA